MLVHTDGQTTITYTATDNSANKSPAQTVTVRLDKRAPAATVTSPAEGAVYQPGAALNASFSCSDPAGGSGLATCAGDVANGAPIDTRTPGKKTFKVTATDTAGNRTVRTVNYSVGDTVAPVLDVPSNVSARATEDSGTPVAYEVSARDAVDGPVAASCAPASGHRIRDRHHGRHLHGGRSLRQRGHAELRRHGQRRGGADRHAHVTDGRQHRVGAQSSAAARAPRRATTSASSCTCSRARRRPARRSRR